MFFNFIKKLAFKDYINFSEFFFDFSEEGERSVNIKVANYDLSGGIMNNQGINSSQSNFAFWVYGAYMVVWLGQILDHVASRKSDTLFEMTNSVFNILFDEKQKYDLRRALSFISSEIKHSVVDNHSTVQFKIAPSTKATIVVATNTSAAQDIESQLYLFTLLFDYFCKNHPSAHRFMTIGCGGLMDSITSNSRPESEEFLVTAYKITNTISSHLLKEADKNKD